MLLEKPSAAAPATEASRWQAFISLDVAMTPRGSVLKRARHQGPLYIQKAFYPEGKSHPHLYILHPPGGMVSGDHLSIQVNVDQNAGCLVTTPGAGRVYRARPDRLTQYQTVELNVEQNGLMEWMPLENIVFNDAHANLKTEIKLEDGAQVIAWDVTCLGLPARKEPFTSGSLSQGFNIYQQGRLVLREVLRVNDKNRQIMASKAGLDHQDVNGLMVAGPWPEGVPEEVMTALQACCDDWQQKEGNLAAGASDVDGFLTIRCVGACSERARFLFTDCWQILRPALTGKPACKPRIWAT